MGPVARQGLLQITYVLKTSGFIRRHLVLHCPVAPFTHHIVRRSLDSNRFLLGCLDEATIHGLFAGIIPIIYNISRIPGPGSDEYQAARPGALIIGLKRFFNNK